jgi:uncharacterized protein (DUF169 family)
MDAQQLLGLRCPPIGIAFAETPPDGIERWPGPAQPAGCSFWQKAQQGETFYTLPEDHYGCAVGAYTHAIDLPAKRSQDLQETVGLMVESRYLEMDEVPGIPRLQRAPGAVVYGPAGGNFEPDVVVITATPAQAMLIYEAAVRSGAGNPMTNILGRPSCGVLPVSLSSAASAMSLGCAGNRLYAGLLDDELYVAIPGEKWRAFESSLEEIVAANERMRAYYQHQAAPMSSKGP